MRMSEKKRMELYNAISERIMGFRIGIKTNPPTNDNSLDDRLFRLELDIWKGLKKSLNIEE